LVIITVNRKQTSILAVQLNLAGCQQCEYNHYGHHCAFSSQHIYTQGGKANANQRRGLVLVRYLVFILLHILQTMLVCQIQEC